MKKLAIAVATVVAAALFAAPAFAESPGQLAGGDLYQVRNVTKGDTEYRNNVAAACGETVKFSFKLSNTEYGMLYGVKVSADLAAGKASATATNSADEAIAVSDTANVTLTKGSLKYVAGSTKLVPRSGTPSNLPDGVTTGGVNAGNLPGSTVRYVQFEAKVDCPEPPKTIKVCELATKKVITIREDEFDSSKHSRNLDDCKEVVKKITVCELATKKIVTIREADFDASKHSKNLADCASKPAPGEITVCELETGTIVNIREDEYDASLHSKDLSNAACVEEEVVETEVPAELPETGAGSAVLAILGLGATTAGAAYAVAGRKNLLG